MKLRLSFVFVVFFSLIGHAFAGEGHVGEIRYSILTLVQFQEKYGPEWELMKGQDIPTDSELLPLWGQAKVPDARGLFLRSSNAERDAATGNPGGELALGSYQADSFKEHDHGGGDHRHYSNFEQSATRDPRGCSNNTVTSYPHHHQAWPTTLSGKIITPEGGKETRPRSIIVNTFIKLRESAPISHQNQVTPQLKNSITKSPEFKTAVETILQNMMDRSY